MRSGRGWLLVWVLVLLIAALALGAVELFWRSHGYQPTIIDSKALWSIQRDRVDQVDNPLVLLGASRTEYGIDPAVLADALPGYTPIMLAINGHHPIAILRQLAVDQDFHGSVLVDIDTEGLRREIWNNSEAWVDYYRHRWSPSLKFHRRLLTLWQKAALIANPAFGAVSALEHWLAGSMPKHRPITYYASRHGDVDYQKIDADALRRHFENMVRNSAKHLTPPSPQQWLADLAQVNQWVAAIQARGGTVIFYASPTTGAVRAVADRVYPRTLYWDRFAASSPAHVLNLRDVPAIAAIPLPDGSHVDMRDKAAYTQALANSLLARGWLSSAATRAASPANQATGGAPALGDGKRR